MPGRRVPLDKPVMLELALPEETRDILKYRAGMSEADLGWSVRCLSGKAKGIRGLSPNLDGLLIASTRQDFLYFAAGKGFRDRLFKVPLAGAEVEIESRFLSENVMITTAGSRAVFRFPRGQSDIAETVVLRLGEMLRKPAAPLPAVQELPPEPEKSPEIPLAAVVPQLPAPDAPASGNPEPVEKEKLVPFPAVG
jgi:hypothetical protein